jgi:putative endonuclease
MYRTNIQPKHLTMQMTKQRNFMRTNSNQLVKSAVAIPPCGIWLCYILCCADDTLYTGITNDLEKRLAAHNAGTASKYTRARGPVVLVFVESCADKSAALKREMEIKSLVRAEKLALINAGPQLRKLHIQLAG